jgi:hypothetical protein
MNYEDLDLLLKIAEDGAVDVKWEQGDLVLLDVSEQYQQNVTALIGSFIELCGSTFKKAMERQTAGLGRAMG